MTPFRREELELFCEDRDGGPSSRLIESAVQSLSKEDASLGFATFVRPRGSSSKSDVHVWTKLTRSRQVRAVGLRDRDFLLRDLCEDARRNAFHPSYAQVKPWPLPRHCIESYLLDDDVLHSALPALDGAMLQKLVEERALARYWLDVARGTVEDFLWRWRQVERQSVDGRPTDRESALAAARATAVRIRESAAEEGADTKLEGHFDALAKDMMTDGPLRCRVDGKELIRDVTRALTAMDGVTMPRGGLLKALNRQAETRPPAALVTDVRDLLLAIPPHWR